MHQDREHHLNCDTFVVRGSTVLFVDGEPGVGVGFYSIQRNTTGGPKHIWLLILRSEMVEELLQNVRILSPSTLLPKLQDAYNYRKGVDQVVMCGAVYLTQLVRRLWSVSGVRSGVYGCLRCLVELTG